MACRSQDPNPRTRTGWPSWALPLDEAIRCSPHEDDNQGCDEQLHETYRSAKDDSINKDCNQEQYWRANSIE